MTEQQEASDSAAHNARFWAIPDRRPVLGGLGFSLLGHVLAIVVVGIAVRGAAAGDSSADLDSGGRTAALYPALCTSVAAQMILLTGVVILSSYGTQRFRTWLLVGWGGGIGLIISAVVGWAFLNAP